MICAISWLAPIAQTTVGHILQHNCSWICIRLFKLFLRHDLRKHDLRKHDRMFIHWIRNDLRKHDRMFIHWIRNDLRNDMRNDLRRHDLRHYMLIHHWIYLQFRGQFK